MKAEQKKQLADALNYIYSVSTKAPVEKQIHDICENAAKELMKFIEEIEVEKELEKVD
jgi:predicted transcriptional regulator